MTVTYTKNVDISKIKADTEQHRYGRDNLRIQTPQPPAQLSFRLKILRKSGFSAGDKTNFDESEDSRRRRELGTKLHTNGRLLYVETSSAKVPRRSVGSPQPLSLLRRNTFQKLARLWAMEVFKTPA